MREVLISLRMLLALSVLTGVLYPLLLTGAGAVLWPWQTTGSLLQRDGKVIGSALLAQKFNQPEYFHPRPSAGDYATVPSAASNLGPTSPVLLQRLQQEEQHTEPPQPIDLRTTSASGLDPHLSPTAAQWQLPRISAARQLTPEQQLRLQQLLATHIEKPLFGWDKPLINVLKLNLALDEAKL